MRRKQRENQSPTEIEAGGNKNTTLAVWCCAVPPVQYHQFPERDDEPPTTGTVQPGAPLVAVAIAHQTRAGRTHDHRAGAEFGPNKSVLVVVIVFIIVVVVVVFIIVVVVVVP